MEENKPVHFIVPFEVLRNVFLGLVALTILTVATSRFELGMFAAPVAFTIAVAKALLVMSFFMGLKYDLKSNRYIFSLGFIFLALLFFFCVTDIFTRAHEVSTL